MELKNIFKQVKSEGFVQDKSCETKDAWTPESVNKPRQALEKKLPGLASGGQSKDGACETEDKVYKDGDIAHRKDGDYRRISAGKWVPVKKNGAGSTEEKGLNEKGMRESLINFMTKGAPHVNPEDATKAINGLPEDTLKQMYTNLKKEHGDKYDTKETESAPAGKTDTQINNLAAYFESQGESKDKVLSDLKTKKPDEVDYIYNLLQRMKKVPEIKDPAEAGAPKFSHFTTAKTEQEAHAIKEANEKKGFQMNMKKQADGTYELSVRKPDPIPGETMRSTEITELMNLRKAKKEGRLGSLPGNQTERLAELEKKAEGKTISKKASNELWAKEKEYYDKNGYYNDNQKTISAEPPAGYKLFASGENPKARGGEYKVFRSGTDLIRYDETGYDDRAGGKQYSAMESGPGGKRRFFDTAEEAAEWIKKGSQKAETGKTKLTPEQEAEEKVTPPKFDAKAQKTIKMFEKQIADIETKLRMFDNNPNPATERLAKQYEKQKKFITNQLEDFKKQNQQPEKKESATATQRKEAAVKSAKNDDQRDRKEGALVEYKNATADVSKKIDSGKYDDLIAGTAGGHGELEDMARDLVDARNFAYPDENYADAVGEIRDMLESRYRDLEALAIGDAAPSLRSIFEEVKAPTQDKRYNIGDISEKTGLQKTAQGWKPVKKNGGSSEKEEAATKGKPAGISNSLYNEFKSKIDANEDLKNDLSKPVILTLEVEGEGTYLGSIAQKRRRELTAENFKRKSNGKAPIKWGMKGQPNTEALARDLIEEYGDQAPKKKAAGTKAPAPAQKLKGQNINEVTTTYGDGTKQVYKITGGENELANEFFKTHGQRFSFMNKDVDVDKYVKPIDNKSFELKLWNAGNTAKGLYGKLAPSGNNTDNRYIVTKTKDGWEMKRTHRGNYGNIGAYEVNYKLDNNQFKRGN